MESQSQFCVQLKKGSWIVSLYPVSLFESILELKLWFNQDLIVFGLFIISSVQSLSCIQLFVTPWTAARQASLSFTNSQSLLKPMSTESVMPSNHLILCLVLTSSFIPLQLEKMLDMISVFLSLLRLVFWPSVWFILRVFFVYSRRIYICQYLMECSIMSVKSICSGV